MRTNIRAIEIFVRAVESGTFVAAARSLLIDPAAVSRAIKGLEEDLGISLFTRSTRVLKLTTEGARFYRDGAQMLKSFEETIGRFRADTALQGQLKIGMGPALSRRLVLRAIAPFQQLHPDIRLILFSINDPTEPGDEGLDIFIRPGSQRQRGGAHRPPQGVVMRKLMQSPIVICASPDYLRRAGTPRTPADLAQHACTGLLTLERDILDEWRFTKANARERIKTEPKLIADGEAVREAGLAGCGIIRVLACNIKSEIQAGALVPVLPDWDAGSLPIVAIYRKARATMPRINAFVRHLEGEFRRGA